MQWIHWRVFWRQSRIRRLQNISFGGRSATCRGRGSFVPDVDDDEEQATGSRFIQVVVSMIFYCYPGPEAMTQFFTNSVLEAAESTNSFIYLDHYLPQKPLHRMNPWICFNTKDGLCNQFATPCSAEGKLFAPPWEAHHYLVLDLNAGTEAVPVPWSFCLGAVCSFKCLGTQIPQKKGTC